MQVKKIWQLEPGDWFYIPFYDGKFEYHYTKGLEAFISKVGETKLMPVVFSLSVEVIND